MNSKRVDFDLSEEEYQRDSSDTITDEEDKNESEQESKQMKLSAIRKNSN